MRGRSKAEGIYIHIADSWCCTAETNIVKTLYFNKRYANSKIKILSWKKKNQPINLGTLIACGWDVSYI